MQTDRESRLLRRGRRPLTSRIVGRIAPLAAAVPMAAMLLIAPALSPETVSIPSANAQSCPDVDVTFARGTGEPPGIGRVGQSFVNDLRSRIGNQSLGVYAVNYPANFDFLDAALGANDASAHLQWMAANCPNTKLVLGGYSQGAAVLDILAAVPFPALGFTNPLPPNVPPHVAAVAVFGNPSTKLGLPMTVSTMWGNRSIDLCNVGDPICSGGDSIPAHKIYESVGLTNQAAAFVANLV